MTTFLFTFALLLVVMFAMALGVILMNKTIKGSCGGLNAISDADQCVVCQKDIDPNSPLRDRLQCPRAKKRMEEAARKAAAEA